MINDCSARVDLKHLLRIEELVERLAFDREFFRGGGEAHESCAGQLGVQSCGWIKVGAKLRVDSGGYKDAGG
jgi:hypothetical protein